MLSKRLLCCAEMVKGSVVADIGTDHALLPIYLVQSGKCERVYACDIAEGPLSSAKKNIAREGLENYIMTVLSDGLTGLSDISITDIIIAGMGGDTIWEIVSGGDAFSKRVNLVLQPNTKVTRLIYELMANGFEVVEQRIIATDRHFYPVLNVRYSGEERECDQYTCAIAGMDLEREENISYLKNLASLLKSAARGLRQSQSVSNMAIAAEHQFTADRIDKLLREVKK